MDQVRKVQSITKVWGSHQGETRPGIPQSREGDPKSFGVERPAAPPVLPEPDPGLVGSIHHPPVELVGQQRVSRRDPARHPSGSQEPVGLDQKVDSELDWNGSLVERTLYRWMGHEDVNIGMGHVQQLVHIVPSEVEVAGGQAELRVRRDVLDDFGSANVVHEDPELAHLDEREDPSVFVARLEKGTRPIPTFLEKAVHPPFGFRGEVTRPGFARMMREGRVHGEAIAAVQPEGELANRFHQFVAKVGQLRAILHQEVPVLPVGEVVVAQVGTADEQGVVEDVDLHVLEAHNFVEPLRQYGPEESSQGRGVVQVNGALLAVGLN